VQIGTYPVSQTQSLLQLGSTPIVGSGDSASGTALGANFPSGYGGDYIDLETAGNPKFVVMNSGKIITKGDNSLESGNTFIGGGSLIMDAGGANFQGNVTGNGYYAGTWTVGSTTAGSAELNVNSASSSARIGISGTASHGCLEFYDAAASGTLDYVYASATVLQITSTKPTFCQ